MVKVEEEDAMNQEYDMEDEDIVVFIELVLGEHDGKLPEAVKDRLDDLDITLWLEPRMVTTGRSVDITFT